MAFEFKMERVDEQIHATLFGEMNLEDAEKAITRFVALIPFSEKFEFHAHLKGLAKYEGAAREAWTRALRSYRTQITRIVIYGARPMVRMAAATVAMIVRLPMEFLDEP